MIAFTQGGADNPFISGIELYAGLGLLTPGLTVERVSNLTILDGALKIIGNSRGRRARGQNRGLPGEVLLLVENRRVYGIALHETVS